MNEAACRQVLQRTDVTVVDGRAVLVQVTPAGAKVVGCRRRFAAHPQQADGTDSPIH